MQPPQLSHQSLQAHVKGLGRVLLIRRTAMDPAQHRNRDGWVKTVQDKIGIPRPKRTIIDLETGARVPDTDKGNIGYELGTLTAMEQAYRLRQGTLAQALAGGQLIAEDGKVLYPPPPPAPHDPQRERERFATEYERDELTGRVTAFVRDLRESTEGMSEEDARQAMERVLDAAEAQGRMVMDLERHRHRSSGD